MEFWCRVQSRASSAECISVCYAIMSPCWLLPPLCHVGSSVFVWTANILVADVVTACQDECWHNTDKAVIEPDMWVPQLWPFWVLSISPGRCHHNVTAFFQPAQCRALPYSADYVTIASQQGSNSAYHALYRHSRGLPRPWTLHRNMLPTSIRMRVLAEALQATKARPCGTC